MRGAVQMQSSNSAGFSFLPGTKRGKREPGLVGQKTCLDHTLEGWIGSPLYTHFIDSVSWLLLGLKSFWIARVSDLWWGLGGGYVIFPDRILDLAQHKTLRTVWATAPWWDEPFQLIQTSTVFRSSEMLGSFHHFWALTVPVRSWTGAPRSSSGPSPLLPSQPFQVPEFWSSPGTKETSQLRGGIPGNWS